MSSSILYPLFSILHPPFSIIHPLSFNLHPPSPILLTPSFIYPILLVLPILPVTTLLFPIIEFPTIMAKTLSHSSLSNIPTIPSFDSQNLPQSKSQSTKHPHFQLNISLLSTTTSFYSNQFLCKHTRVPHYFSPEKSTTITSPLQYH